jgi:hypothetical protein
MKGRVEPPAVAFGSSMQQIHQQALTFDEPPERPEVAIPNSWTHEPLGSENCFHTPCRPGAE